MELFVQNLRKRAEEIGLPQAEVARRAGLSERRFGNYATGAREPDLATLLKIASVLGTTPNDLLGVGIGQSNSSALLLQGRLAAAAATMSEDDLRLLVVEAEAIVAFRAAG
jgi:transcriptional regulator with XRE-family HTH domain